MTIQTSPQHPAPFSEPILDTIVSILRHYPQHRRVLDPFAGTGRVHRLHDELGLDTVGIELEPEWADMHPRTMQGDARWLPFPAGSFDAIVTSPVYGNRMSDHHDAKDASRRYTYRHRLGRPLTDGNAGMLQWGRRYRDFHREVWVEALRMLRPGGLFVLNISDHVRKGERQRVALWHCATLETLGAIQRDSRWVVTRRQRHGANGELRVDAEQVAVFEWPGVRTDG